MGDDVGSDIAAALSLVHRLNAILPVIAGKVDQLSEKADYHDVGKGFRWEAEFSAMAEDRGLVVEPRTDSKHDCRVNGMRVQCKRVDKSTGCICTTPVLGRSFLGYCVDDWDVLAMRQHKRLLIIPAAAMVSDDGHRLVNKIMPGEWCDWEDRWDVFGSGFLVTKETQKTLFRRTP